MSETATSNALAANREPVLPTRMSETQPRASLPMAESNGAWRTTPSEGGWNPPRSREESVTTARRDVDSESNGTYRSNIESDTQRPEVELLNKL